MSSPTPFQSFVGGLGLTIPVHALLLLNGDVFGISGFLHRAVQGNKEAIAALAGLALGGALVGIVEGPALTSSLTLTIPNVLLSGFLVGIGSKVRTVPPAARHSISCTPCNSCPVVAHLGTIMHN